MTWGSQHTGRQVACRFCGARCVDDEDEGLNSHEFTCFYRPWWRRIFKKKG